MLQYVRQHGTLCVLNVKSCETLAESVFGEVKLWIWEWICTQKPPLRFVLQAYVSDFNVFFKSDVTAEAVQVTHNGKENEILNGVPDWVYEGE